MNARKHHSNSYEEGELDEMDALAWIESSDNEWSSKFRRLGIVRTIDVLKQLSAEIYRKKLVRGKNAQPKTDFSKTFAEFQKNIRSKQGSTEGKWQEALLRMLNMCRWPDKQIQDSVPVVFNDIAPGGQKIFNDAAQREGLPIIFPDADE